VEPYAYQTVVLLVEGLLASLSYAALSPPGRVQIVLVGEVRCGPEHSAGPDTPRERSHDRKGVGLGDKGKSKPILDPCVSSMEASEDGGNSSLCRRRDRSGISFTFARASSPSAGAW